MLRPDIDITAVPEQPTGGNGNGGGDSSYALLASEVIQIRNDLKLHTKVIVANTNKVEAYIVRQDDTLKNHNKRMEVVEREVLRLTNQGNSVFAATQAVLTNVGTAIGNLTERVTKVEYYQAGVFACVVIGALALAVVAARVW